ncbi:hypothetical protein HVL48_003287 [Escherichia coli]|nr:hypothetical protein [Escherichia coli]
MVHQHYGTQTVNRGAVMPGMLVKHKDGTWTASANLRGRLYLHRGIERTYTRDLLVEVFLDGRGNGLNHYPPLSCFPNQPGISRAIFSQPFSGVQP